MSTQPVVSPSSLNVRVRPLREGDVAEAERIFHLAFGTYLGLPDPMQFCPDRSYARPRYHADPESGLAAEVDGEVVGSNFATRWGSVGFFGPLTVRPDYWERGIAKRLLEPTMQLFEKWQTRHTGLFTFPHSPKHVHLYQKFGFWPRFLTAVMSAPVQPRPAADAVVRYSELTPSQQSECLNACRQLTDAICEGLDVSREIRAVAAQKLGDAVLVEDNAGLAGLVVCHCGAGTEAGEGTCYVKFGAARSADAFERLLDAVECFAHHRGLTRLEAGVNFARDDAHRRMQTRGFHTEILGVAMHKSNKPGYNRPGVYLIDDWR